MQNDYIDKLERVLYFVSTFHKRNLQMNAHWNGTKELYITEHLKIEKPYYELHNEVAILLYTYDKGNEGISIDHVVKTYPHNISEVDDPRGKLANTHYDTSYYHQFLFYNKDCDTVEYQPETQNEAVLEIPDYDLNSEDGEFQYILLHDDEKLGIMQVVQYFKRKGHHSFGDWMHPAFDKIYEELNEHYDIGREDYLRGDGVS